MKILDFLKWVWTALNLVEIVKRTCEWNTGELTFYMRICELNTRSKGSHEIHKINSFNSLCKAE